MCDGTLGMDAAKLLASATDMLLLKADFAGAVEVVQKTAFGVVNTLQTQLLIRVSALGLKVSDVLTKCGGQIDSLQVFSWCTHRLFVTPRALGHAFGQL